MRFIDGAIGIVDLTGAGCALVISVSFLGLATLHAIHDDWIRSTTCLCAVALPFAVFSAAAVQAGLVRLGIRSARGAGGIAKAIPSNRDATKDPANLLEQPESESESDPPARSIQ